MHVHNSQSVVVSAPIEAVFDHACDPAALTDFIVGWGPVPDTVAIELLDGATEQVMGTRRRVQTSDGASLEEEVLVLERPTLHRYRLYGDFVGLAKLLVREGVGEFRFEALGPGQTRVTWSYSFELRSVLALPLGLAMVKIAFAGMQRASLARLAAVFERGA